MRKVLLTVRPFPNYLVKTIFHSSPNELSPCWWNTSTVVVTFLVSGAHVPVLPNITSEPILPCPASSRTSLHYLRKPMSQLMQAGGGWEVEQSTFPGIVSGAANRFFTYTFSFWWLWIPIPPLHLASSQPHFIIQHAHKKSFISSASFP